MGLLDNFNINKFEGRGKYKKGKEGHELELKLGKDKQVFCYYCGKRIKETEVAGVCNKQDAFLKVVHPPKSPIQKFTKALGIMRPILCSDCSKKCKKCERIYCPEHIKDHKCL